MTISLFYWVVPGSAFVFHLKKSQCTFVYFFFQFCSSTFTAEAPDSKAIVEIGKDGCKIDVLSCFKMEHLFHTLEHNNLLRDFAANLAYMLFKFSLSSIVTPGISKSSVMGISVFSQWNWGVIYAFPMPISWYYAGLLLLPFSSSHMSRRAGSLLMVSSIFADALSAYIIRVLSA